MAGPIVLKGSSPSGDTVIAISSSDPNVEKYLTFNFPTQRENFGRIDTNPSDLYQKTFSTALAGTHTTTGRGFPTFNPFLLPFFNIPFNFEGLNFGPWLRGVESQDSFGNGDVRSCC
ncbi:uncharacterized protein LOC125225882 isoform X2 [Leguminivora glycinivorella]|nr:uncharacterized protein LOC125225882 isoform X2 [Leguminivora glycinivorella]